MWALKRLGKSEAQTKLEDFHNHLDSKDKYVVPLGHARVALNTFDPDWWVVSFTDLFYRGDFRIPKGLKVRPWAALLFRRCDFREWAGSKDFAVAAYNIALRRDQMLAVCTVPRVRTSRHWRRI